jgi:hypothetical protein
MALTEYHGFEDSVRWKLCPAGVEIDGTGLERTRGAPRTATRVWEGVLGHDQPHGARTTRAVRVDRPSMC